MSTEQRDHDLPRERGADGALIRRAPEQPPLPDPLTVPVFDNHTHLDPEVGTGRRDDESDTEPMDYREQLDRASSVGVRGVVQVGTDVATSRWGAEVAEREPRVLAAVAIHPNAAPELHRTGKLDDHLAEIYELAGRRRVRAVGESGLDYFRTGDDGREAQIRSFEQHIEIARERGLALQIHDRDAHEDVVRTLKRVGAPERTVFHCFSGDAELAEICAEHGWYLSFAGTVTFKNAEPLRRALEVAPRDRILVETDAPYLTPMPHRGRPNSPAMLPYTVRAMAAHLGADVGHFAAQLASNTETVYGSWDAEPVLAS